jgi:hypothetical protein
MVVASRLALVAIILGLSMPIPAKAALISKFVYFSAVEETAKVVAKLEPPQPMALDQPTLTVSIPLVGSAATAITKALSEKDNRVLLNLRGIDYQQNPGAGYEIYLNQPVAETEDRHSNHYAGVLHFYNLKEAAQASGKPAEVSFDITEQLRQLSKSGQWSPQELKVTFVRRGVLPPKGAEAPPVQFIPRVAAIEIMVE